MGEVFYGKSVGHAIGAWKEWWLAIYRNKVERVSHLWTLFKSALGAEDGHDKLG